MSVTEQRRQAGMDADPLSILLCLQDACVILIGHMHVAEVLG